MKKVWHTRMGYTMSTAKAQYRDAIINKVENYLALASRTDNVKPWADVEFTMGDLFRAKASHEMKMLAVRMGWKDGQFNRWWVSQQIRRGVAY